MTDPASSAAIDLALPKSVADHGAIAALYDTCGREAFAIALMMVSDRRHAERVVAEAFTAFRCEPPRTARPAVRIRTLLLHHAYHAAARHLERAKPALLPQPVLRRNANKRRNRQRADLLNALPTEQREALLLCLHGASCSELAALHDEAAKTIASRLHCALTRMQELHAPKLASGNPPTRPLRLSGERRPKNSIHNNRRSEDA